MFINIQIFLILVISHCNNLKKSILFVSMKEEVKNYNLHTNSFLSGTRIRRQTKDMNEKKLQNETNFVIFYGSQETNNRK